MYQKDVAKMVKYASAGYVTYGTHSECQPARAWVAFVPRGANPDGFRRKAKQDKLAPLPGSHAARSSQAVEGAMSRPGDCCGAGGRVGAVQP